MKEINKILKMKNENIIKMLDRIKNGLYKEDEKNNWGHVGSTAHIEEELKNICEFMGIKL